MHKKQILRSRHSYSVNKFICVFYRERERGVLDCGPFRLEFIDLWKICALHGRHSSDFIRKIFGLMLRLSVPSRSVQSYPLYYTLFIIHNQWFWFLFPIFLLTCFLSLFFVMWSAVLHLANIYLIPISKMLLEVHSIEFIMISRGAFCVRLTANHINCDIR